MITSPNLANAIVKLVAADALPALLGHLLIGNLVQRDYEPVIANHGDKVSTPIPGTPRPAQVALDTHTEATFQIPDVTKAVAFPELLRAYMLPAVTVISERIERDLLGFYSQFTVNPILGIPGTPIAEDDIDAAETFLFAASPGPRSGDKFLVVDPPSYSSIRHIPGFSEYHSAGEAGLRPLVDGNVGKLNDFFVFRSPYVAVTGNENPTAHNLAFTRLAMLLASRRLPRPLPGTGAVAEYAEIGNFGIRIVMSYSPNTLAQSFTVDILYGCTVPRNDLGVQIQS